MRQNARIAAVLTPRATQIPQGLSIQKITRSSGTQTATKTRHGPRETIRHHRSPRQALSHRNRPATNNNPRKSFADAALSKKSAPLAPRKTTPRQPPAIGKALTEILNAIRTSNTKEEILGNVLAIISKILLDS
ncbi:hypothetical protein MTP99_007877 [Tenebrio molitor]|nr:hypothetical protein MTP99_007877 [Tenebrio molitor]